MKRSLLASICLAIGLFGYIPSMRAQGVPRLAADVDLSADDTRSALLSAHSGSTLLSFTVEADSTGKNLFDVATSDAGVVVTLILPSGTEVNNANAASLGFGFSVTPAGSLNGSEIPSVFLIPGTHTVITIPAGQVSGVYKIKLDASAANTESGVFATYFSSSTVRTAATTSSANYRTGDTAILSALVFDGATPVTGASVNASVSAPVSLVGQTVVGNYQLVSQQAVNSNLTDFSYTATLTNSGGAVQGVQAQLRRLLSLETWVPTRQARAQTSSLSNGTRISHSTFPRFNGTLPRPAQLPT